MRKYFIDNTLFNIDQVLNGEKEYKDCVLKDTSIVIKELLKDLETTKTEQMLFKPGDKAYCLIGGKIREIEVLIAGTLYDNRKTEPTFCISYRYNIDGVWIKGKWDSQMPQKIYKTREEAENDV